MLVAWAGATQGGAAGLGDGTYELTYVPGVALLDPVYLSASDTVDRADATTIATGIVLGVVAVMDFPAVGQCLVRRMGLLGGFVGLTPGAIYVMSTTPGLILPEGSGNPALPSGTGEVMQSVGQAVTATELAIDCSTMSLVLP
jgi:hypothetical protein